MLIFTYFIPTYGLLYLLFTLLVNLLFTVKKIFDLLLTLNNLLVNFHLLTSKNHAHLPWYVLMHQKFYF